MLSESVSEWQHGRMHILSIQLHGKFAGEDSLPKTEDCSSAYIPVFWDAGYKS